ncbi:MAG: sterol desaturase family protein [Alphaproteobacteria bacterium]|nr:sterol desaturase family protein [Alphaproteobacteria bacterium]
MNGSEATNIASDLFALWQNIFLWEFGRYLFFAGIAFLVIWHLLGPWIVNRKIRKKTPRARQMWREAKNSAITAFIFSVIGMAIWLGKDIGLFHFYDDIGEYGWPYFIGSLMLMIVLHDAWFYWTHRLMHLPGMMKYIHAEHHKSINPTPWAAYSFDPYEATVHALFSPLFLLVFPMHGLATLLWMMHMLLRNVVGHSGYELFPRRWAVQPILRQMTLVTHHDMHHQNGKYNFGLYFSWWDRWMGTEHPDYIKRVTGDAVMAESGQAIGGIEENAYPIHK